MAMTEKPFLGGLGARLGAVSTGAGGKKLKRELARAGPERSVTTDLSRLTRTSTSYIIALSLELTSRAWHAHVSQGARFSLRNPHVDAYSPHFVLPARDCLVVIYFVFTRGYVPLQYSTGFC